MEKKIVQLSDKSNNLQPLPVTVSDAVYLAGINPIRGTLGRFSDGEDVNGLTLTEFINKAFCFQEPFSFLHISDTHKSIYGLNKCKELMDTDESIYTLVTGDLQLTAEMKAIVASSDRFLVMLGNHDVADDFAHNQADAKANYITPYMTTRAVMGDPEGAGSYWHKDFVVDKNTIRIISFDEYEYTEVGTPSGSQHGVVYSQKQMNWFINLLKNTPSDYYLILAHHQPVSAYRNGNTGEFVSEKAPNNYEYESINNASDKSKSCDPLIIPKIMDAYLKKAVIEGTFFCGDVNGTQLTINEDFSASTPCQFLFHIGGHTHWDVCEYLPLYPEQLQLVIDQDRPQQYKYSDLIRSTTDESAYCINRVTIDFDEKKVKLERIGAHLTDSNKNRQNLEFKLKI
ncbi:metallophosphoesterase [Bacteroides sp. BFG-606]|uniref:metallophosphoesterase family protein n=1 Tax=Bacteroides sp. BFG-606 TaxID=2972763 RepID=UPI00216575B3|nr:metallophosphoesterase [Bacteroides sp. BFG-606]MCS2336737.1 metallophosphoesterase [Bacteroides sp. BFG-606]